VNWVMDSGAVGVPGAADAVICEASLLICPSGCKAVGRSWHLSRDDLAVSERSRDLVMVAGASTGRSLHPSG
jgi:hypothetical protein